MFLCKFQCFFTNSKSYYKEELPMAASGSTQNLGLNQWAETDHVLREDFNSDNQKIDAALSNVGPELLGTINVSAQASNISINVADIDWSSYSYVYIDYYLVASAKGTVYVRANNTTSGTLHYKSFGDSTSYNGNGFAGVYARNSGYTYGGHGRIVIQSHYGNYEYLTALTLPNVMMPTYGYQYVKFSDLNTFNFVPSDSSVKFTTATKFKIWGVK